MVILDRPCSREKKATKVTRAIKVTEANVDCRVCGAKRERSDHKDRKAKKAIPGQSDRRASKAYKVRRVSKDRRAKQVHRVKQARQVHKDQKATGAKQGHASRKQ
jgi:hypothetical protein